MMNTTNFAVVSMDGDKSQQSQRRSSNRIMERRDQDSKLGDSSDQEVPGQVSVARPRKRRQPGLFFPYHRRL